MKILLAGAGGNIGYYLFTELRELVSSDSIYFGSTDIDDDFTNLDFSDYNKVKKYFNNCRYFDALIFLVGLAHKKGKNKDLNAFNKVNYQTLTNLLSVLAENNRIPSKIIFASTISVYGERLNQSVYKEGMINNPLSPYAKTKLKAEEFLIDKYCKKSWILRFAPVYSPDFRLNIDSRIKKFGWFYKVGSGSNKLSLCCLENIGILIKGILKDKIPAGTYNISDKKIYTYNDLLNHENVKRFIPIPSIIVKGLYYIGGIMNNIFLKENSIKLISDNIFPSNKIREYINLPASLENTKIL